MSEITPKVIPAIPDCIEFSYKNTVWTLLMIMTAGEVSFKKDVTLHQGRCIDLLIIKRCDPLLFSSLALEMNLSDEQLLRIESSLDDRPEEKELCDKIVRNFKLKKQKGMSEKQYE